MRFIQLVHTLSYGDAISGEVLALNDVFEKAGFSSEVYALNVHPKLKGRAKQFRAQDLMTAVRLGDVCVILHYSLGSPMNDFYLSASEAARRILIYHNLTPAFWFQGVNGRVFRDIEAGCRELPELLQVTDTILADSHFNACDLQRFGLAADDSRLAVLELPVHPDRWSEPANPGIAALLRNNPGPHLLHVGRLAPNKCIEDIIRIFYFFHHKMAPTSKLWIVGIDTDTELYSFALKRLAHELRLDHAISFTGALADSELRAMYESASMYICMSEHEGFCLPLVEAMHFGLPVLAYDNSAVSETVASAGILVKEKRHAEIAALIHEVLGDPLLHTQLVQDGHERAKELSSFEKFSQSAARLFLAQESLPLSQKVAAAR